MVFAKLLAKMPYTLDELMLGSIVKECIPLPEKIYKHTRTRRLRTTEEMEQYFPCFKAFIDSAEQEIPRPENRIRRKIHYSGKKKKHTVKTQFMVNSQGLILHKTRHKGDYHLYIHNHPATPSRVVYKRTFRL